MSARGVERNHGDMSAATINHTTPPVRPAGATALRGSHAHRIGDALRAVKVFLAAAFDVIVLGEYDAEARVRRV